MRPRKVDVLQECGNRIDIQVWLYESSPENFFASMKKDLMYIPRNLSAFPPG